MKRLRVVVAGALMLSAPALAPCAVGQVVVLPASVEASLAAGGQSEVEVRVTNEGMAVANLFAVPLPEGGMPEDVGELLFSTQPGEVNNPNDLAMAPWGRIFAADHSGQRTWEYTLALERLRIFDHPQANPNAYSATTGMVWMPPEHAPPGHEDGTLWWMDVRISCSGPHCTVLTTLLIEGDLAGIPTGRTVDLYNALGPGNTDSPLYYDRGVPNYLSYDAEAASGTGLFYYIDAINEDIWAINVEGNVPEGYPVPQTDYDSGGQNTILQAGLDATRGSDDGAYLEGSLGLHSTGEYTGVVVADRQGRNTGVETPLDLLYSPDGQGEVVQILGTLRSRLDPSVMYLSIIAQYLDGSGHVTTKWIVAIRAHPLPPRWLRVAPVAPLSLAIAPGETDTLTVRFDTEGMGPGVYAGQVALRAGGPNGEEVVSVPVTLAITPTDTEDGAEPEASRLVVFPNPARGAATVSLMLAEASEVRVVVYDVLGRGVAVLHEGEVAAGTHRLTLESAGLPAGLYLVRAEVHTASGTRVLTARLTHVN